MIFMAWGNVGNAFDEALRGLHARPSRKVVVPDLVGTSVPDMWGVALRSGVRVQLHRARERQVGAAVVVGQRPPANTKVRRDSIVHLDVRFGLGPLG